MPLRLRKFIGTVALFVLVIGWALIAMAVAQFPAIRDNTVLLQLPLRNAQAASQAAESLMRASTASIDATVRSIVGCGFRRVGSNPIPTTRSDATGAVSANYQSDRAAL